MTKENNYKTVYKFRNGYSADGLNYIDSFLLALELNKKD
jgi:hypothetical protein